MKKILIILCLFAAQLLAGQDIYTVYDRADEAKFEIYDPISPKRFRQITDSLLFSFDASTATSGCKWVQDFSLNGGHSDCRIREIVIVKNPPNRRMVISKGCDDCITLHTYSDTVNYCAGDLDGYEVEQFERRGYVMVDTCGLRLKWPTRVDSIAILSSNTSIKWPSMSGTGAIVRFDSSVDSNIILDTKLDTITIRVLCNDYPKVRIAEKYHYIDSLSTGNTDYYTIEKQEVPYIQSGVSIQEVRVERTLEWQMWYESPKPDRNGISYSFSCPNSGWREISRQYLDSIEGCYQLVPLKE